MKFVTRAGRRASKLIAIVLLLSTAACGTTSSTISAKPGVSNTGSVSTVRIGLIVPTTGPLASGGAEILAGSQAAVSVWNSIHKDSKASITTCNDQGTGSGAQQCVYKLQGSVSAIAGPDFATDYPGALSALESSGKLIVTLSQEATPTPSSSIFVAQPSVKDAVDAMIGSLQAHGYRNIGILVDQEPGGTEAIKYANSYGHAHNMSVESASFSDTAASAVPEMQRLLSASPQALLIWTIGNAGRTVLKAVASLNVTIPLVMNYFNVSPALFLHAQLPTTSKVGVLASVQFLGNGTGTQESKNVAQFNSAYRKLIHQPPSWAGSVGGNAVDLIMSAEHASGPKLPDMVKYIESSATPIPGPAVSMSFTTQNHIAKVPTKQWAIIHYDVQNDYWTSGY